MFVEGVLKENGNKYYMDFVMLGTRVAMPVVFFAQYPNLFKFNKLT